MRVVSCASRTTCGSDRAECTLVGGHQSAITALVFFTNQSPTSCKSLLVSASLDAISYWTLPSKPRDALHGAREVEEEVVETLLEGLLPTVIHQPQGVVDTLAAGGPGVSVAACIDSSAHVIALQTGVVTHRLAGHTKVHPLHRESSTYILVHVR